ncbi:MAG: hypothetical protein ACK5NF_03440 [Bacilli bacterium]
MNTIRYIISNIFVILTILLTVFIAIICNSGIFSYFIMIKLGAEYTTMIDLILFFIIFYISYGICDGVLKKMLFKKNKNTIKYILISGMIIFLIIFFLDRIYINVNIPMGSKIIFAIIHSILKNGFDYITTEH